MNTSHSSVSDPQMNDFRKNSGSILFISGPMFSGKTTLLMELANKRKSKKLCLKPSIDTRYHHQDIVSHDQQHLKAVTIDPCEPLSQIPLEDEKFIFIDEVQFFNDDIITFLVSQKSLGKHCVVAGLNYDAKGIPFGPAPEIEQIADKIIYTTGTCSECTAPSTHTHRKHSEKDAKVMIGGDDLYEALCLRCFQKKNNKKSGYSVI